MSTPINMSLFTGLRVLVVDDNEQFRGVVGNALSGAGSVVTTAENGKIASVILMGGVFDLVVSDVHMPEMDGIELIQFVKKEKPSLPIILMTGFSDLKETHEALEMGAAGFIPKPFKRADLFQVMSMVLNREAPENKGSPNKDLDYCRIPIRDFLVGSHIRYPIYIRITESNYLKIANQGEDLTPERIRTYLEKNIAYLYLSKEDFKSYTGFSLALMPNVAQSSALPKAKKLEFLRHSADLLSKQLHADGVNEEIFASASAGVEAAVSLMTDHDELLALLSRMKDTTEALYAHSVGVSLYSVMLAKAAGWTSAQTLFKVSMSGMLHNIGLREIPVELVTMSRSLMTPEQIKIYESHTNRGLNILSAVRNVPEDVARVAAQHHEDCLGTGYPLALPRSKIHPLAKLISVADIFVSMFLGAPGFEKTPPREAATRIYSLYRDRLEGEFVAALLKLFDLEPPRDLQKNRLR